MTYQEMIDFLESVYRSLQIIEQSETWKCLSTDDLVDSKLITDMGDALHYVKDMLLRLKALEDKEVEDLNVVKYFLDEYLDELG